MEFSKMKDYIPHRKIKELAVKNGVKYTRALKVLSGILRQKPEDEDFINDCIQIATAEKRRITAHEQRVAIFA